VRERERNFGALRVAITLDQYGIGSLGAYANIKHISTFGGERKPPTAEPSSELRKQKMIHFTRGRPISRRTHTRSHLGKGGENKDSFVHNNKLLSVNTRHAVIDHHAARGSISPLSPASLLLVKKEKDEAKTLTGAHGVFEPGRECHRPF
jgi:hypothetical protein